jgi:hypothetical protein
MNYKITSSCVYIESHPHIYFIFIGNVSLHKFRNLNENIMLRDRSKIRDMV